MARSDVAIIIPAYNEADTIARVVASVLPHGVTVVVDDASSDQTAELAEQAGAIVVRHGDNRGYDGALNSGFAAAVATGCRFAVTFDADGQHDINALVTVVDRLRAGDVMVIGVRARPARAAEWLFAAYTRLRFGVADPLCGLKGYSLDLYQRVGHFDSYGSIGTELMLRGIRSGRRYSTLPIPISPRHGQPRFAQTLVANGRILRALFLSFAKVG